MENERIAKLETTVESIKEAVSRLEEKFDELFERIELRYLPRNEFERVVNQLEAQFERAVNQLEAHVAKQDLEIEELKKNVGKAPAWMVSLVTALISLIGGLILALLNKFGG